MIEETLTTSTYEVAPLPTYKKFFPKESTWNDAVTPERVSVTRVFVLLLYGEVVLLPAISVV